MEVLKKTNTEHDKPNAEAEYKQEISLERFSSVDYKTNSEQNREATTIVGIQKYRELLSDDVSSDEQIIKRLQYIEALCRNVVRNELHSFIKK
ncbi:MAG: hypothetical protein WC791_00515 [Candidatus Paceibacterota bacterium]|jgi:hypothetical protein